MSLTFRRAVAITAAVAVSAIGLTACTASGNGTTSNSKVSITVAEDVGLQPAAKKDIENRVAKFEKKYPNITVTPQESKWTATTFAAQLAGGTLPDVFTVAFTDGKGLIQQHQVADVSTQVAQYPWSKELNASVLKNGQDSKGKLLAVPIAAYGQALHYNRQLFKQAGLDPDKPPTTWAQIRKDAKQIAQKTGKAGFATMTQQNTGGWILTTMAYALGGRGESEDGTKATVDSDAYAQALGLLHDMRWDDNAMGSNFLYDWNGINQAFVAGQLGMYISGGGNYASLVSQNSIDPAMYGESVIPLQGKDAGALGGGTLAMVSTKATKAQQDAAVKWIDYFYMENQFDEKTAKATAKAQKDDNQAVGVPQVPVFDKATYDKYMGWIAPYVNVPTKQFSYYTDKEFAQPLLAEPAANTQDLYGALDPVVQAVLTDQNADIPALLKAANTKVQGLLDAAQ
ncbi:extracellular solute-binding protein [Planctomonas sp. JC2975]|uniref:ABC transporter substrate-binding protein n=1 Tax=Planctomonas sp. JC2975 TaxID=2729626 RepID=UPI00147668D0|nr:extracellular solute-binding protein [Planctomonas sp. JC2975]NNC12943.1 extracellular solute-binding protein [Planctomonas sp. JC2975]